MAWISTIRDFVSSFFEVASMLAVLTVFEKEKQKSGIAKKFIFSACIAAYTVMISLCNMNQLFMLLNYVAIAGFSVIVYKFPVKKGIFFCLLYNNFCRNFRIGSVYSGRFFI